MAILLLAGCQTPPPKSPPSFARFYLESTHSSAITATLPQSGVSVPVAEHPVLSEYDFTDVQPGQAEFGRGLQFKLTSEAVRDFQRLAEANRGQRVVLFIDGQPVGARKIAQAFDGRSLTVFVEVPDDTLPRVAEAVSRTSRGLQKPVKP